MRMIIRIVAIMGITLSIASCGAPAPGDKPVVAEEESIAEKQLEGAEDESDLEEQPSIEDAFEHEATDPTSEIETKSDAEIYHAYEVSGLCLNLPFEWRCIRDEVLSDDEWSEITGPRPGNEHIVRKPENNITRSPNDGESQEDAPETNTQGDQHHVNGIVRFENDGVIFTIQYSNSRLQQTVDDATSRAIRHYVNDMGMYTTSTGSVYGALPSCTYIGEANIDGINCPIYHLTVATRFNIDEKLVYLVDDYRVYLLGPEMHYEFILSGGDEQLMAELLDTISIA